MQKRDEVDILAERLWMIAFDAGAEAGTMTGVTRRR